MNMTLRWYGSKFDTVTLKQIRQIPGVKGVITMLHDVPAGEVWPLDRIEALKAEVEAADLKIFGIESVNVHDAIKIGSPDREKYIANYITSLENLGKAGITTVCYNFMPVFDWTRTDLAKMRSDGSTVLAYDQKVVDTIDPQTFFNQTNDSAGGFAMPGWEPERLAKVKDLFEAYKDVDEDKLFDNLIYFLKAIRPTCEQYGIKMAIHPDDPAWPVFNLPRIITSKEKILKVMNAIDAPFNGLTFCAGSFGTNPENDLPGIIRALPGRIHFAHVRNLHHFEPGVFEEAAHLSSDGSFDLYEIVKALYETGFEGPVRPDHGRMIWDEVAMPGYGLYDRAIGAAYILGLHEAIEKNATRK
ncbi:MAG TPA: mannonate dehydratase [Sphaerochaeta sp.]|nr:mannonate dehydratase [Sphaerochaeta sp.]